MWQKVNKLLGNERGSTHWLRWIDVCRHASILLKRPAVAFREERKLYMLKRILAFSWKKVVKGTMISQGSIKLFTLSESLASLCQQTFHPVSKSCQHLPENFSSSLKVLPSFANKLFIQSQSLASLCQQTFHPVLKSCWPLQWMFESIYIAFYLSLVSYFEVGICWKGSLGSLELFLKEIKDCAIPVV